VFDGQEFACHLGRQLCDSEAHGLSSPSQQNPKEKRRNGRNKLGSVMHVEAKINYVNDEPDGPFVSLTVIIHPDITESEPDHLEFTWHHYLDLLRWNLPPYVRSQWPWASDEVLAALYELTHPLIGRLFPKPEQCLTRKQLIRDYGCSPSDIAQLPYSDGRRCGKHRWTRLYDPEHPKVRALIGIPHEELHCDHGPYDL
jgi:hypothetical protein